MILVGSIQKLKALGRDPVPSLYTSGSEMGQADFTLQHWHRLQELAHFCLNRQGLAQHTREEGCLYSTAVPKSLQKGG